MKYRGLVCNLVPKAGSSTESLEALENLELSVRRFLYVSNRYVAPDGAEINGKRKMTTGEV